MEKNPTDKPYKLAVLRDRKGDLSKPWYVEFYAYDESQKKLIRKRVKVPINFNSAEGRKKYAARVIKEINQLLREGYYYTNPSATTVVAYQSDLSNLHASLESMVNLDKAVLRKKSIITYLSPLNKFKEFLQIAVPVADFKPNDALRFRDWLINIKKNSARTANNNLEILRTLFGKLMERESIVVNPFVIRSLPTKASDRNIAFTTEDQRLVEEYMLKHEPELYILTRFIYYAFIRPGELNNLKIKHIYLEQGYISIPGSISKSKKMETVPIIPPLRPILTNHIDGHPLEYYLFGKGLVPNRVLSGKQVAFRRHEKLLKALKIHHKGYTLYSWKHTAAVNAYLSGVGIKQLQTLLRHSSVQITDIYLKSLGLRTDPNLGNYNW